MIEYNVLIKWGKYEKTVKQETNSFCKATSFSKAQNNNMKNHLQSVEGKS